MQKVNFKTDIGMIAIGIKWDYVDKIFLLIEKH